MPILVLALCTLLVILPNNKKKFLDSFLNSAIVATILIVITFFGLTLYLGKQAYEAERRHENRMRNDSDYALEYSQAQQ